MLDKPDNPYAAPQIAPRPSSGIFVELLKRAAWGLLVAVIVFQIMVQFNWQLESGNEGYRAMMHCGYAVLVAMTSVFTQSKQAKAAGKSGIIPACLLFVIALIGGVLLARFLGVFPYPFYRGMTYTLEMSAKVIGIVTLLDFFLVALHVASQGRVDYYGQSHDNISRLPTPSDQHPLT